MKETAHWLQGRENKYSYPPKQEKKEKTRLCTKKKKRHWRIIYHIWSL